MGSVGQVSKVFFCFTDFFLFFSWVFAIWQHNHSLSTPSSGFDTLSTIRRDFLFWIWNWRLFLATDEDYDIQVA
jgi:hypothetical protein